MKPPHVEASRAIRWLVAEYLPSPLIRMALQGAGTGEGLVEFCKVVAEEGSMASSPLPEERMRAWLREAAVILPQEWYANPELQPVLKAWFESLPFPADTEWEIESGHRAVGEVHHRVYRGTELRIVASTGSFRTTGIHRGIDLFTWVKVEGEAKKAREKAEAKVDVALGLLWSGA